MSYFIGLWQGYTEGTAVGRAYVRISGTAQHLEATALVLRSEGFGEAYKLRGREISNTEAVLEMAGCAVDFHSVNMPRTLKANIAVASDGSVLDGKWATDIGTLGNIRLYRANGVAKFVALIPFCLHLVYRTAKRLARKYFRYAYLIFTVMLAVQSLFGHTAGKISMTEAVMLLTPLLFMFRDKIYNLILSLRLRKAGPFEFYAQLANPPAGSVQAGYDQLRDEFGNHFQRLDAVARFIVPRTRYLLQVIDHFNRELTQADFFSLTRGVGIPEDNIVATHQALINAGCVAVTNSGSLVITEFGRQLLHFDRRAIALLAGSV